MLMESAPLNKCEETDTLRPALHQRTQKLDEVIKDRKETESNVQ